MGGLLQRLQNSVWEAVPQLTSGSPMTAVRQKVHLVKLEVDQFANTSFMLDSDDDNTSVVSNEERDLLTNID